MQVNEGLVDRIARLALALVIIVLFFMGVLQGYWALLLIFSGMFLMSGFTGYCPLYVPLGINTCKK
jgi:Sec-independent protein secretion pathway component TatC